MINATHSFRVGMKMQSNHVLKTMNSAVLFLFALLFIWTSFKAQAGDLQKDSVSSCSCAGFPKRVCLFVHGQGIKDEKIGAQMQGPEQWSIPQEIKECCSEMRYTHLETFINEWYSEHLAQGICQAALEATSTLPQDRLQIKNLAIITHSMGSLIFSHAIVNGICGLDTKTSKWISIQGPMRGSYAANFNEELCDRKGLYNKTLSLFAPCPLDASTKALQYYGSNSSAMDKNYDAALEAHHNFTSAVMCSEISNFWEYPDAWLTSKISGHRSPNDGEVEIESCRGLYPLDQFQVSPREKLYRPHMDHEGGVNSKDSDEDDAHKINQWVRCQLTRDTAP